MRVEHFEALGPICPICRSNPLEIHRRERGTDDEIEEGALVCTNRMCQAEYPILDSIPYIVSNVGHVISQQLPSITRRPDLSDYARSLLGDAAGPDSAHERERYQVSSYARSHYGDLDPDAPLGAERCIAAIARPAIELVGASGAGGVWLDFGCGPGRSTFELAAATGGLVVGVDLNVGMLKVATNARRGRVEHPLRRVGLVYDRREFDVELPAIERVDFWICDVLALPLPDGSIAGALDLNVLDCVASPLGHLQEVGRVLADGAPVAIASPFDWATAATPLAAWIGGHGGRAAHRGSSTTELARLLADGDPAQARTGLVIDGEPAELTWDVYVHERATMRYQVHLRRATRLAR